MDEPYESSLAQRVLGAAELRGSTAGPGRYSIAVDPSGRTERRAFVLEGDKMTLLVGLLGAANPSYTRSFEKMVAKLDKPTLEGLACRLLYALKEQEKELKLSREAFEPDDRPRGKLVPAISLDSDRPSSSLRHGLDPHGHGRDLGAERAASPGAGRRSESPEVFDRLYASAKTLRVKRQAGIEVEKILAEARAPERRQEAAVAMGASQRLYEDHFAREQRMAAARAQPSSREPTPRDLSARGTRKAPAHIRLHEEHKALARRQEVRVAQHLRSHYPFRPELKEARLGRASSVPQLDLATRVDEHFAGERGRSDDAQAKSAHSVLQALNSARHEANTLLQSMSRQKAALEAAPAMPVLLA